MATAPIPPVTAAPTPVAPMSEAARIVNTFIAPSKTFTDLRRSAAWWGPWILISVFSLVFIFSIGKQVTFEQASKNQVERSSSGRNNSTSYRPTSKLPLTDFGENLQRSLLMTLRHDSVYLPDSTTGALGDIQGGSGSRNLRSARRTPSGCIAGLPGIVGAILGIVSLFAGVNPEGFDINNPVGNESRLLSRSRDDRQVRARHGIRRSTYKSSGRRPHRHRLRFHQQR